MENGLLATQNNRKSSIGSVRSAQEKHDKKFGKRREYHNEQEAKRSRIESSPSGYL